MGFGGWKVRGILLLALVCAGASGTDPIPVTVVGPAGASPGFLERKSFGDSLGHRWFWPAARDGERLTLSGKLALFSGVASVGWGGFAYLYGTGILGGNLEPVIPAALSASSFAVLSLEVVVGLREARARSRGEIRMTDGTAIRLSRSVFDAIGDALRSSPAPLVIVEIQDPQSGEPRWVFGPEGHRCIIEDRRRLSGLLENPAHEIDLVRVIETPTGARVERLEAPGTGVARERVLQALLEHPATRGLAVEGALTMPADVLYPSVEATLFGERDRRRLFEDANALAARREAAALLSHIDLRSRTAWVREAMLDPDEGVRLAAVNALRYVRVGREYHDVILAAASDAPAVRIRAIEVLWGSGTPEALGLIGKLFLGDSDIQVQRAAIKAIAGTHLIGARPRERGLGY